MRVLAYRVGEEEEEIEIDSSLISLQEFVGGHISILPLGNTPFIAIRAICNDSRKKHIWKKNREILHLGKVQDIICGDFLVCKVGDNNEGFSGLTDDDMEDLFNSNVIGGMLDD